MDDATPMDGCPRDRLPAGGWDLDALAARLVSPRRVARFEAVASRRLACLTVAFDRIGDPHNVSASLRSAEIFGVPVVYVLGDVPHADTETVSMYAGRWVEARAFASASSLVEALRGAGFSLLGTVVPAQGGKPFDEVPLPAKTALVMGNEHDGLSAELRAACDGLITIPTAGFTESLNLSVATAILLQHFQSRYVRAGGDIFLAEPERRALVRRWMEREVARALRLNRR
ncbi:MAG: tRNA (guanosine(18)-2'-O)-methyltransferase [Lentisphaerae bacterium ADurb.BinA184]|nr:MAG: tRNA (guanosine(18)-2'-O)-methyltransferase [Lentisphaerae bacterium ADurb.BinA184]